MIASTACSRCGRSLRRRVVLIAEPVGAVKPLGVGRLAHERPVRADEDRHVVAPHSSTVYSAFSRRLLERDVSADDGDRLDAARPAVAAP